ncbi:MAG: InlB B-repeat-containing protein [Clostridia bacterium]|nr:InlB B-repeat-containing protein [Clostridia bacterium]
MKKMKKLLCMLLAFVIMASSTAVGASAYESYTTPAGYNSLGKPVYSYEQSCSMLLDWLDALLYDMNINEEIDIVVATIKFNLTSINNTYNSLVELMDMGLVGFADALSLLGEITDLSVEAIRSPRRASSMGATDGTKDSVVFYALLQFLYDNAAILEKLVNTTLDMGSILPLALKEEDYPYLYDLPNFLKEMIYTALYNSFFKAESEPEIEKVSEIGLTLNDFTIDGVIQDLVDSLLIGDYNVSTQSYTGFLPSMAGKTSITNISSYDLIQNAIDALMADILVPTLVESLPDTLSIETSAEWPYGNPEAPGLLPTIVGVMNDMLELGYEYDPEEYPVIELHNLATWLLVGEEKVNETTGEIYKEQAALYDIISFTSHGLDINDKLYETLRSLLRELGPGLIQMIFPDEFPEDYEFRTDLAGSTTDDFISYIVQLIIPLVLPEVRFLPDCDTVQECLTYILISLVIDLMPENDYYGMIENGTLDPENGAWIEVGVDYLTYLINNLIDVNIPADADLEGLIDALATWVINNYGFAVNTRQDLANMNGWEKLDNILFSIIDPTMATINVKNGKTVSESFIYDTILVGVQEFNIEKILSFIGKNGSADAVLNKPLVEFVLDLLGNVLSVLMNGKVIIPENVTRLETLVVGNGGEYLGKFVRNLLEALYTEREYNFPTLIPLIGQLIGLSANDNYTVYAPADYPNKSVNDLKKLMAQYIPDNGDLKYFEEGYFTIGEEDYEHLYQYEEFMDTYEDCEDLIELYNTAPYEVTSLDIKNLYYRLGYYYDRLTPRSELCKLQVFREIEYATRVNVATNEQEDGTKLYTDRSWRLYQEALANAQAVNAATNVKQSQLSKARQELFKAQNGLKPYVGLARYELLDYIISLAEEIPEEDYKLYKTDTLAAFQAAYDVAVNLDRDYDQDDQEIVSTAANDLQLALGNLTLWEINYELGADIVIDSSVAQDGNTVLKFREASGAAVENVTATVNNNAVIGEVYREGDYYCWVIEPGAAPLYSVITASISFTQPTTGKTYKAQAYTFVSAGKEIVIDANTCQPGYIRNRYQLSVHGINDTSVANVTYHVDHSGTNAGYMASVPTGMIYVDTSVYSDLSQVPGLMFTITKDASSYEAGNIGSGSFSAVNVDITSSDASITVDPTSYSMTLFQTDVKNFKFSGKIPAAGQSITTLITPTVTATATNGGATTSYPQFYLRVYAYDKSVLRATVAEAIAACRQEWFYSGGWDIYKRDLEEAVYVLNNPLVTQEQINEADDNLKEAVTFLEYKTADYKELHKLISIANSLNPYDYEDFSPVTVIINKIEYDKGMLEQSLIDETVEELRAAIDNLTPAQGKIYIRCYNKSGEVIVANTETEVSVVNDEGGATLISTDIIYGNVGERVLINVPQIMGYSSTDKQQLVTITSDGVVVAFYYSADEYTVRLNANGGKVSNGTVTVTYGETYADLPVPTRDGYVFAGWYTKLSGGMKIDENTKVTTSYYKNLYAHWEDDWDTQSSDITVDSADTTVESGAAAETEPTIFEKIIAALSQFIGLLLSNVFGIG